MPAQPNVFEPGEGLPAAEAVPAHDTDDGPTENGTAAEGDREMTLAQKTAIQAAIANAATLEEVSQLEKALATGQLPSELQVRLA